MQSVDVSLDRYASTREVAKGDYVCREGDPGNEMYVVESGQVAIVKHADTTQPVVLGYKGPGEMIGEISLIQEGPRTASILATEDTVLQVIGREDFWVYIDQDPVFRRVLMDVLISRLLAADASRVSAANAERDLIVRLASISSEHEKLAELVQLRQETTHFIVHDLRNPLNLVMFALSMVGVETGGKLELKTQEEVEKYVNMANGALQRVLGMVEAMLDVDRLDSGQESLNRGLYDLVELVGDTVQNLQPMASASMVKLELDMTLPALPQISLDKVRVERVLTNLIDNGLKFTTPGGTVTVGLEARPNRAVVYINDAGPGIPADKRERIFDRFAQLESQQKRRGFGLGLAYCRSAVVAHGGEVWAEDGKDGVGTRFVFTLPMG